MFKSLLGKLAQLLGRLLGVGQTTKRVVDVLRDEDEIPPSTQPSSPRAITPRPPPLPLRRP